MNKISINIMSFNLLIMLHLLGLITASVPPELELKTNPHSGKNDIKEKIIPLNVTYKGSSTVNISASKLNKEIPLNNTQDVIQSNHHTIVAPYVDSSALYRLFYVLLGLCTIIVVYVSYSFYKTRKGTTKLTTVRKYGVLTQRTDIEMLPLPIDEDEEDDDTVFDVGNHMNR